PRSSARIIIMFGPPPATLVKSLGELTARVERQSKETSTGKKILFKWPSCGRLRCPVLVARLIIHQTNPHFFIPRLAWVCRGVATVYFQHWGSPDSHWRAMTQSGSGFTADAPGLWCYRPLLPHRRGSVRTY